MKKTNLFFAGLVVALMAASAFSQASEVRKTDVLVKSIDAKLKKSPELVFADVTDQEKEGPEKWEKFASEKALDKHRESAETYSIAYCWNNNGKLAKSNFTLFSPSGDWTEYVFHYFRPDGTLAKAEIDYRTFEGDIILLQYIYFGKTGNVIKMTNKVLDLTTHKPKKMTKGLREEVAEMKKETPYYKTVSELPFAKLIK